MFIMSKKPSYEVGRYVPESSKATSMSKRAFTPVLQRVLSGLATSYSSNQLAYLALTQKVEHTVRDMLAFQLHRLLSKRKGILVCREWRRTDLAILQDHQPRLLLEAKAIYTFDITKNGAEHPYPQQLAEDIEKAENLGNEQTEILALLLATHPHDAPAAKYRSAIKYFGGVKKYCNAKAKIAGAHKVLRDRVKLRLVQHGEIPGGRAFGVPVSVAYWLFKSGLGRPT